MLLSKSFKSLNQNGACIVYENFIDDERRDDTAALLMSVNMLFHFDGGSEMTKSEVSGLMEQNGFKNIQYHQLTPCTKAMIGFKL